MRIIIAGAGDVGIHLTSLLSNDGHDITVIDIDHDRIDYILNHFDVSCLIGKSSSPDILRQAGVSKSDILISCTDSDENNILTSMVSKRLGVEKTISRIKTDIYSEVDLGIDDIVTTSELAAKEVKRLLVGDITDSFEFSGGVFNLLGLNLGIESCLIDKFIGDVSYDDMKVAAVLRNNRTIIPTEKEKLKEGDLIYFLSKDNNIKNIENICGKSHITYKNIIISGINEITEYLVKELTSVNIKVFDQDTEKCRRFSDKFQNCLVVNSVIDQDAFNDEGMCNYDCIISVNENTEKNIISCLLAKKLGVKKTIALVSNTSLIHLSQNIGIDTLINEKMLAADSIYKHIRNNNIVSQATLHGVDAEVLEYTISPKSKLINKVIGSISFPGYIIGITRFGDPIIPTNDFRLQVSDSVIIIVKPSKIKSIESFF
jgi:trk system potassium uptake protein TrkA